MIAERLLIRMASGPGSAWRGVALALALPLTCTVLRLALEPVLKGQSAFVIYFPAVFLTTLLAGFRAGLAATGLSGLLGYGLFLAPGTLFALDRDLLTLALFWSIAGLLLVSVAALRRALRRLGAREGELQAAAEREALLAQEMVHRVKNLLAIVQSLVRRSARDAVDVPDFRRRLAPRLDALAAAQRLACDPVADMTLEAVVAMALAPVAGRRVRVGPLGDGVLDADTAQGLLLALHELSTNAAKYGALSTDAGQVTVASRDGGSGMVVLDWMEAGGPRVESPATSGFGSRLIRRALRGPGEGVELRFAPEGLQCRFRCKLAAPGGTPVLADRAA